jgi:hypothetical protein
VTIFLDGKDTKFEDLISKPKDYWYEVELNPDAHPQTIIGYGEDGPVLFKLFPEGAEVEPDTEITEEDIPVVDAVLDATSHHPIENQAVARAILALEGKKEVGVVHLNNDVTDCTFYQMLTWCKKGIPVMMIPTGNPPVFAVAWNDEYIYFRGGTHMTGVSDTGFVNVRFMKYKILSDGTVENQSETYGLKYV